MKPELSQRTINRLTQYHTVLREYSKKEIENITSSLIASCLKIDETQVRKDLKSINCKGKCKVGYVVDELKRFFPRKVYTTVIPRNVKLSEAPSYGLPIAYYDKNSKGALAYDALANEFLKLNGKEVKN